MLQDLRPNTRSALLALSAGLAYFVAARAGTLLVAEPAGVVALWPASGILLAALLTSDQRHWRAIAITTLIAGAGALLVTGGASPVTAVAAAAGWAEGLVAALLATRLAGGRISLDRVRNVLVLIAAIILASAAAALVGTAAAVLELGSPAVSTWVAWWSADAVGMLAIAPLALALRDAPHWRPRARVVAEAVALLATLMLMCVYVFGADPGLGGLRSALPAGLALPLLAYAALRLGRVGTTLANLVLSVSAAAFTVGELGPFATSAAATADRLFGLRTFLAATLGTSLVFAALVAERRREAAKRHSAEDERDIEKRLVGELAGTAFDAVITLDADGIITNWNPAAERIFGWTRDEVDGRTLANLIVPANLRLPYQAALEVLVRGGEMSGVGERIELKAARRDGELIPVELTLSALRIDGNLSFYLVVHDLSALRALEGERADWAQHTEQARADARAAERDRDQIEWRAQLTEHARDEAARGARHAEQRRHEAEEAREHAVRKALDADRQSRDAAHAQQQAEQLAARAEERRGEAEQSALAAEERRAEAESRAEAAGEEREQAEQQRRAADQAREEALEARAQAEQLATDAERRREDAEEARAQEKERRRTAVKAREEAEQLAAEAKQLQEDAEQARAESDHARAEADERAAAAERAQSKAEDRAAASEQARKHAERSAGDADRLRAQAEQRASVADEAREQAEQSAADAQWRAHDADQARERELERRRKAKRARKEAERLADEAAALRAQADQARAEAEQSAAAAERSRKEAEADRASESDQRRQADEAREQAERLAAEAERKRQEAEHSLQHTQEARAQAEQQAAEAELRRRATEQALEDAQLQATASDLRRGEAEHARIEADRRLNELERQAAEAEGRISEAGRRIAEADRLRLEAERARDEAEQLAASASEGQRDAEQARVEAERRAVAAGQGLHQAERERVEAERRLASFQETHGDGDGLAAADQRQRTAAAEYERHLAELDGERRRLELSFDEAPLAMALADVEGRLLKVNSAFCELTARPRERLETTTVQELVHSSDHELIGAGVRPLLQRSEGRWRAEVRLLDQHGREIPADLGVTLVRDTRSGTGGEQAPPQLLVHATDLRRREALPAGHDPLTGLPDRRRLEAELERGDGAGALIAIDLDGVRELNESHGRAAGDDLVAAAAGALREQLRGNDALARVGGDRFALVLAGTREQDARRIAEGLLEAIRALAGDGRRVSASAGVLVYTGAEGLGAEELLVEADLAVRDAKQEGRDRAVVHRAGSSRLDSAGSERDWAQHIRDSLDDDCFVLHAQPIVSLASEDSGRHELLLRLTTSDGDLIPPSTFLYVAERFGLAQELDRFALRSAARALAGVPAGTLRFEVNLSASSVADPGLPDLIAAELGATGATGGGLCIAIDEAVAIENVERARQLVQAVRRLGCEVVLDHFGSGLASFHYLQQLAVDYVKIDGSYIEDLPNNRAGRMVVKSVVDVSRSLDCKTIAAHVGDAETLSLLQSTGVDFAQGFFLGRPRPLEELELELQSGDGGSADQDLRRSHISIDPNER